METLSVDVFKSTKSYSTEFSLHVFLIVLFPLTTSLN